MTVKVHPSVCPSIVRVFEDKQKELLKEMDRHTQGVFGQDWHAGCRQSLGYWSVSARLCKEADLLRKRLHWCRI